MAEYLHDFHEFERMAEKQSFLQPFSLLERRFIEQLEMKIARATTDRHAQLMDGLKL